MGEIIRRGIDERDISHLDIDWNNALELAEQNAPSEEAPELTDEMLAGKCCANILARISRKPC